MMHSEIWQTSQIIAICEVCQICWHKAELPKIFNTHGTFELIALVQHRAIFYSLISDIDKVIITTISK